MNDDYDLVLGELSGYRVFTVKDRRLVSIGYGDYVWTPGANQARCDRVVKKSVRGVWVNDPATTAGIVKTEETAASAHGRIPAVDCGCGLWILKTEADCRAKFGHGIDDHVIGRVTFWGRTIEHDEGYRAEYARITGLVTDEPERFADVLGHYGIPAIEPARSAWGWAQRLNVTDDGTTMVLVDNIEAAAWYVLPAGQTVNQSDELHIDYVEDDDGVRRIVGLRIRTYEESDEDR